MAMMRTPDGHSRLGERLPLTAGVMTAATSLLYVGIILGGPAWYRFFGAGERMAQQAARGFVYPTVVTAVLATILACSALYAFSAAGLLRWLPLTRLALVVIAVVFLARGMLGVPVVLLIDSPYTEELRGRMTFMWVTSAVSFVVGLCYALGAVTATARSSGLR